MLDHFSRFMKGFISYLLIVFISFFLIIFYTGIIEELFITSLSSLFFWISLFLSFLAVILIFLIAAYVKRIIYHLLFFCLLYNLILLIFFIHFNMDVYVFILFFYLFGIALLLMLISPVRSFFSAKQKCNSTHLDNGFKFGDYRLYCRDIILEGSKKRQRIYYFCKQKPKAGTPCDKPDGFEIQVNKRTGMPYLKRKK